jgi:hypothetical protein
MGVKGILVVSFDWPSPDDIPASLEAMKPPSLPHFAGEVRVAVDDPNDEDVASKVISYLEDEGVDLP